MTCPLCGTRRARRSCPAVGAQICAVCCGTKRLVDIACPPACPYLTAAREHPAAAEVKQRQRDLALLVPLVQDLNTRQAELLSLIASFLRGYESTGFGRPIDDDVAEAMEALASTYETAVRGIIYEQRPASGPADRLTTALKPLLADYAANAGTAFERDAAVLLRRFAEAARRARADASGGSRTFLEALGRVMRDSRTPDRPAETPSRLIVP